MKKETIEYFEKMRDAVVKHENSEAEQAAAVLNGQQGNSIEPPYSWGAMNAFRCYEDSDINHSTVDGEDVLECMALPNPAFAEDFLKTLREAEAEEIILTDESGLLEFLHRMTGLGCTIDKPCIIHRKIFNLDEQTDYGIRLKI